MELAEVEFLAHNVNVGIVPNFSHDKIYLIEVLLLFYFVKCFVRKTPFLYNLLT